ncbi:MAG TPA: hypothetical protein VGT40_20625 [Methylomirabilota bacterium]|jgi:hypothetical protein|nr:hypothetical protein [Methylomirabilota bacterium]
MRLRTLILWAMFVVVFGWAGYTLTVAGWEYFVTQDVVERTLRETSVRHRSALLAGTQRAVDDLVADTRASILLAARRDGLTLPEGSVSVSANSTAVAATVRWPYTVISYGGAELLVVPMSVQRSLTVAP